MESRSEWNADHTAELGIFAFKGREFSALGAVVTPEHLTCYPNDKGEVLAWDGTKLGTYTVLSSRRAIWFGRRSHWADRYYFMRAKVGGRCYSLRGFGPGMLARGRALKAQS
jgi:hypothetical protein